MNEWATKQISNNVQICFLKCSYVDNVWLWHSCFNSVQKWLFIQSGSCIISFFGMAGSWSILPRIPCLRWVCFIQKWMKGMKILFKISSCSRFMWIEWIHFSLGWECSVLQFQQAMLAFPVYSPFVKNIWGWSSSLAWNCCAMLGTQWLYSV